METGITHRLSHWLRAVTHQRKSAGLQQETLNEKSCRWGRVCSGVQCPEMSLKSCHNFRGVFLAFTYLVLKFNRSNAGLPHCTGPQLIKILHYPTLLRGYEKPLEPIHPRVRVILKKPAHGHIHEEFLSCFETAEAAIITRSSNARVALSVVFLYMVLNSLPLLHGGFASMAITPEHEGSACRAIQCCSSCTLLSSASSLQPAVQELNFYKKLTAAEGDNNQTSPLTPHSSSPCPSLPPLCSPPLH